MFGMDWDSSQQAYNNSQEYEHDPSKMQEFGVGAAGFMGMKMVEDHQRKEGKEVKHGFLKEMAAAAAAAEVDKWGQEKWEDHDRAREDAKQHARDLYDQHYTDQDQSNNWKPNSDAPRALNNQFGDDYGNSNYNERHDNFCQRYADDYGDNRY
ncbi:MAG: hypothetical protein Q9162_004370 [Coniocarpon cinnabarinum]